MVVWAFTKMVLYSRYKFIENNSLSNSTTGTKNLMCMEKAWTIVTEIQLLTNNETNWT